MKPMTQYVGEQHRVVKVGELAHIPAGVPHATFNTGAGTLRFLAILRDTLELDKLVTAALERSRVRLERDLGTRGEAEQPLDRLDQ